MTCICSHTQDEHERGIGECSQCDCEMFLASKYESHDYDSNEWGP